MKKMENTKKTNFFKKLFIKICRIIGFEIIDQANFISRLDKLGESDRVLRRVVDVLVKRIRGEGGTQV